ncbi:MAG: FAD-dependent oxidoreductase [Planctomycetes bacterium]|nr:FAD-dependent oxidoreductase [Planctomycetota bacterium]
MPSNDREYEYVIVGGGPSTRILNHYLNMANPDVSVCVIRNEERIANHCSIPYIIDGTVPLHEGGLTSDRIVTRFGTDLIKEKVISGDAGKKYVTTDAGTQIGYEKLVFATGAEEALPPIPGTDLPGAIKVRDLEDFRTSLDQIEKRQSFVVLGAGYVGLEIGCALQRSGKEVRVVELLPHIMGNRYDPDSIAPLETTLREHGIDLRLGHKAVEVGGDQHVEFLELENGNWIHTDALVLATGVKPRIGYAEEFGLETAREGIVVDEYFRTNLPDVYALGDCIQTHSFVTRLPFPGKLGSVAAQMARTLALNFNGKDIPFEGVLNPACTKLFDLHFCSAGHTEKDARDAEIDVICGKTENTDIYSNMPHNRDVFAKLVFRRDDRTVIGGEMVGAANFAGFADCLAQLIHRKATIEDIATMDVSTHPELTPNPAHSYLMFAAQKVLQDSVNKQELSSNVGF